MRELDVDGLPEVLTVEQAGRLLQLPPDTVRKLLSARRLPGRKIGREWRLSKESLLAFVAGQDNVELSRDRPAAGHTQE